MNWLPNILPVNESGVQSELRSSLLAQDRSETHTIVDFQTEIDMMWSVDLFNDEIHTFEEVIHQLIKATGCTRGRAEDLSWTVHREGKANVYQATFEECLRVAGVLGEIGLLTQIKG